MYKLNLVLMVVLSSAVIGAGVFLAMEKANAQAPGQEVTLLIRRLGDSDPDVRRDAEAALKKLGPNALPGLKSASMGDDQVLAGRVKSVIQQIEGAPVAVKTDKPEVPVEAPAPATVEISLQMPARATAGDPVRIYARFRNGTPQSVVVARHKLDPALLYGTFAAFEITNEEGTITVPVDLLPRGAEPVLDLFAVGAGQMIDLYPGQDLGAALANILSRPGTWRVRLVYDASEGSAYREALALKHPADGVPLRPERLASNTVTITVE